MGVHCVKDTSIIYTNLGQLQIMDNTYKLSTCCNGMHCIYFELYEDQPCWGQVIGDLTYDEDGFPLPTHVCQGHKESLEKGTYFTKQP